MLNQIKQWIADNTFNIEDQAGAKYEVIDVDEIKKMFAEWESMLNMKMEREYLYGILTGACIGTIIIYFFN
jgi:hypothetical protein